MSLRAMMLKYNTTMSPARLLSEKEQAEIRRRSQPQQQQPQQPQPIVQVDQETESPFPDAFYTALNTVLHYGASNNLGPTRCSRLNYLWFATSAMAYQWTQPPTEARIQGTKDRWDWSQGTPLVTNKDQYIWMNHMWEALMPSLVPTFQAGPLLAKERAALGWTEQQQLAEATRVQAAGDWAGFQTAWAAWRALRQTDGSEAQAPPTAAQLPNGATVLDVQETHDPNNFPQPAKWTPLKVGTKTQNYLTWNWMAVRATVLSGEDGAIAQNAAKREFLTDPAARAAEITEVLTISEQLTDAQKVQAEFWAGGPGTVSPPGMMIWFWRTFLQHTPNSSWSTLVYSGLDLATHLFETARLVWGLKKHFMEARPIQMIRAQHRGEQITKYDGTPIAGEAWVPYQETNFVTPPFADFPSGHSAFCQSFANVMTAWFGPSIPAIPYTTTSTDLALLSPALTTAPTNLLLGSWTFPQAASLIQPAVVPANPVTFSYSTWQEMADAAGISRQLGGIHAASAHVGSQAMANALHQRMGMRWGIPKTD